MIFIKERVKPFSLFLLVLGIFLLAGPLPVWAHDVTLMIRLCCLDLEELDSEHVDTGLPIETRSKGIHEAYGYQYGTSVAWGDFHFGISVFGCNL